MRPRPGRGSALRVNARPRLGPGSAPEMRSALPQAMGFGSDREPWQLAHTAKALVPVARRTNAAGPRRPFSTASSSASSRPSSTGLGRATERYRASSSASSAPISAAAFSPTASCACTATSAGVEVDPADARHHEAHLGFPKRAESAREAASGLRLVGRSARPSRRGDAARARSGAGSRRVPELGLDAPRDECAACRPSHVPALTRSVTAAGPEGGRVTPGVA